MFPPVLKIFLFGEPYLEYKGQRISLPQRESLLRLFVRLTLQAGQVLARKQLAFALWPDVPETESLANLRRHLYLLRNILPAETRELLRTLPQSVCWQNFPLYWLDVNEFQQTGTSLEALKQAVELYRDDLALGVYEDDFVIAHREALRNRYLDFLKKLAAGYFERGEFARALEWVRRLIALEPWDEEVVRLKMTLESQTGNRAAALTTYQTLARELEHELHTQPMPETMTLYSDILHSRISRPSLPQKAAPVFIGREAELEQLVGLFRGLVSGQGWVVFVSGPAGVGKTALTQEALRRLPEEECESSTLRILWGTCPPPMSALSTRPYAPWSQILAVVMPLLARSEEIQSEWLNRLLPLVPDLALFKPGLLATAHPNADELRAAIRQAFYALALAHPLILVLEDAHWADDDSLQVLRELTEISPALPLLILVTHRLDDLPLPLLQLKRTLRQRRVLVEIPLRTFSEEESRSLLKILLHEETLPPVLYEELTRYAGGLPLLLCEAAETILRARGSHPVLPTLRDSIVMRMERLNHSAREMLEAAALLGFSFSDRELQALLGWPEAAYAAALDGLSSNRFLSESVLTGMPEYTFSHQLIHEIILETIPAARAAFLHQQTALALQKVHAGKSGFAGRIAAHYQAAGQSMPAAHFWLEHARENTDLAAFEAALQAIERAESLLTGDASLQARELRALATLQRGVIAHYRGQASDALPLLQEALRLCSDFPPLRAQALTRMAYALYTCDRYAEAWQSANESLQLASTLTDSQAIARALNIRAMAALMLGQLAEAIQDLRKALALEECLDCPSTQTVQSLNHLGTTLVFVQDYAEAGEVLAKTVELARRGGLRRLEAAALTMQGQVALNCGRYPEAVAIYRQAIEVAGDSYLPGMWGKFAGRGVAYLRMGRLEEAQADFEQGLEVARQVESRYGQLLMRIYLAFTALAGGHVPSDSLSALESKAAALDLHAVVMMAALFRARLRRLAGDFSQASAAGQCALQAAQASNVPQFIQNAQLEWLYTQAQSGPIDRDLLETLARQAQESGETPQQILAQLTFAAVLRFEDQRSEARAVAEQALALARACADAILTGEALMLLFDLYQSAGQTAQAQTCRTELLSLAQTAFAPFRLAVTSPPAESLREIIVRHS